MTIDLWAIIKNSLPVLWKLWPLWLTLLVLIAVRLMIDLLGIEIGNWRIRRKFKQGEAWRSDRDLLHWLRGMSPDEFEGYIAHLFKDLGYATEVTGASHDGGIDIVAEKNGIKHYIQCKKFIIRHVPVGAIRDFYGAIADRGAQAKGFFITTNTFTLDAEKFAESIPVELIDGYKLCEYIKMAQTDAAIPPAVEVKVCPVCASLMIKRKGRFGEFYGCSRYPQCEGTLKV
jgi:restriction system protein